MKNSPASPLFICAGIVSVIVVILFAFLLYPDNHKPMTAALPSQTLPPKPPSCPVYQTPLVTDDEEANKTYLECDGKLVWRRDKFTESRIVDNYLEAYDGLEQALVKQFNGTTFSCLKGGHLDRQDRGLFEQEKEAVCLIACNTSVCEDNAVIYRHWSKAIIAQRQLDELKKRLADRARIGTAQ